MSGPITITSAADAYEQIKALQSRIDELTEALWFYGNPDNYFAVGIFGDRPCGQIADDVGDDHGHPDFDRPMHGWYARRILAGEDVEPFDYYAAAPSEEPK